MTDLSAAPPARLPFPVTRAYASPVEAAGRGENGMPVMRGQFSTFDDPYEINSHIEGRFLETVAPGAFDRTIAESRHQMKVLYDHGKDPSIGNKVLGPIDDLTPDARYTVPLFDTSYNRDLAPGLEAGVYGSSHRFAVISDEWDYHPRRTARNPEGIPERRITEARVYEFGPVTFPANPSATAGLRSTTDDFYQRSADATAYESVLRSAEAARLPLMAKAPTEGSPQTDAGEPRSPETDAQRPPEPPPTEEARTTQDPPEGGSSDSKETPPVSDQNENPAVVRADRPSRITELRGLTEQFANEHDGALSRDEQVTWDSMVDELRRLEADEAADAARRAFIADRAALAPTADQQRGLATQPGVPYIINSPTQRVRDIHSVAEVDAVARNQDDRRTLLRDSAMRGVETATFHHPDAKPDVIRGHIQYLLDNKDTENSELARRVMRTGSKQYLRAFSDIVRGVPGAEARYAALEVVGTTTTGGYAVPYSFDPTMIPTGAYTNINPFRQVCRVEQIVGANKWQGVSVGAVLAAYDTESDATSEGGPTFSNPSVTVTRATSAVTLSYETMQDRPDIVSELAVLINEAKDTLEENKFAVGAGSNNSPLGMFVKSTFTVKETITNDTFAVADLDATEAALPIRHRRPAIWMLSRGVIRIIQGWETAYGKLFNSTLGYPAVGDIRNNPGGNTGMNLLGYPVWETPSAPVTVTTDDTIVGILVNPSQYIIVDRVGMDIEVVPNLFDTSTGLPTGRRAVLAVWRNSATALNADGGRQININ